MKNLFNLVNTLVTTHHKYARVSADLFAASKDDVNELIDQVMEGAADVKKHAKSEKRVTDAYFETLAEPVAQSWADTAKAAKAKYFGNRKKEKKKDRHSDFDKKWMNAGGTIVGDADENLRFLIGNDGTEFEREYRFKQSDAEIILWLYEKRKSGSLYEVAHSYAEYGPGKEYFELQDARQS